MKELLCRLTPGFASLYLWYIDEIHWAYAVIFMGYAIVEFEYFFFRKWVRKNNLEEKI